MAPGKAPIVEASTVDALLARQWSHRSPVPTGILAALTVCSWGVWFYLVLPLVSLLLWAFGARFLAAQIREGGYEGLLSSLVTYAVVLFVLVGLLAAWIAWNVARYSGSNDRRTVKRAEIPDWVIRGTFRIDDRLLAVLRAERLVRVDFGDDGVVAITNGRPAAAGPALAAGPAVEAEPGAAGRVVETGPGTAGPEGPPQPQRDGESALSG